MNSSTLPNPAGAPEINSLLVPRSPSRFRAWRIARLERQCDQLLIRSEAQHWGDPYDTAGTRADELGARIADLQAGGAAR